MTDGLLPYLQNLFHFLHTVQYWYLLYTVHVEFHTCNNKSHDYHYITTLYGSRFTYVFTPKQHFSLISFYSIIMSENENSGEKDVELGPLISKKVDMTHEHDHTKKEMEASTTLPILEPSEKGTSHHSRKALNSCFLYCFCSVAMVLANKSLASRYVLYICTLVYILTSCNK